MAGLVPVPVIQKDAWAQCENPNCQKWRKLPPGTAINEDEPWYCYMNPDFHRNTCSASEVDYDQNNELVIDGADDPEEAARNREIMAKLEASIAAAAAAARGRGRGRGRGRPRGSGRGRGRPPLSGRGRGRPPLSGRGRGGSGPPSDYYGGGGGGGGGGRRGGRSVSFLDDFEEDGSDSDGARSNARVSRRQVAKQLQRLLDCQGQWDAPRGVAASGPTLPPPLPAEAWEALGTAAPEAADLACAAADLASSLRYFEGAGPGAAAAAAEVGSLARLGTMLAAGSGLVDCQDVLTRVEREQLGLEGAPPLPDPTEPLPAAAPMPPAPAPVPEAAPFSPLPMPSPPGAGLPPRPPAMPFPPPGIPLPPGVAMNPMALALMQQMMAAQHAAQQAQQQQKMAAQSSFAPQ